MRRTIILALALVAVVVVIAISWPHDDSSQYTVTFPDGSVVDVRHAKPFAPEPPLSLTGPAKLIPGLGGFNR